MRGRQRLVAVLVVVAVGLAFADASVVALALPDLYAEFDTSIVGVSWVLTSYALVVALTAIPVALFHRRVHPLSLVVVGVGIFAAASLVAGFANSLALLLAARCGQGVGATLLLAGSLPVLGAVAGARSRRWWAMAGAIGAAIGPALGGVLTQLFDWRAIFFVQAPVVAAALVVAVEPAARALRHEGYLRGRTGTRRRDVITANIGFALVFAALVGALFLGVLMAIEVWRYSPIRSAVLVSALPLGMAVGRTMKGAPRAFVSVGGALLLAVGLVGLALLPGEQPIMAAVAFALCGAGFDLVHEVLDAAAVPADGPAVRASAVSIGARHAGLVLGLVLIAPVLSSSLEAGIDRATLGATQTMLQTELSLRDKLPVTWALRTAIEEAPRGQVPDLAGEFDERGAEGDNAMARARDELMDTVTDAVTRSFRPAFGVAAALA
ncbi:MAG: MFS transporter, partial [Ilumatobacteraceae bacterium]